MIAVPLRAGRAPLARADGATLLRDHDAAVTVGQAVAALTTSRIDEAKPAIDRRGKFPADRQKFPARPSREFATQSAENTSKISTQSRPKRAFLPKFPAKFPASREFRASFNVFRIVGRKRAA